MKNVRSTASGLLALAASTLIAATLAVVVLSAVGLWSIGERMLMLTSRKKEAPAR